MAEPNQEPERRALIASIVATSLLSALGVLWGIAIGSQMVLFDGVFGLVGIATSALLLRASTLAAREPSRDYQYGQEAATPLVIGIQGFILLATFAYAALEALATIRLGGSRFAPGAAIPYGAIATASSIAIALWLRRSVRHSDLIHSESTAWLIGGMRGAGMLVGFGLMWLLDGSSWHAAVPYIDPAMVLLTCVLFIRGPLRMVSSTIHELLEGAPAPSVQAPVLQAIADVRRQFNLEEPVIRITKVGSKLYVDVDACVAPEMTIVEEHEVRRTLKEKLHELPYEIWLNLDLLPKLESPGISAAMNPPRER